MYQLVISKHEPLTAEEKKERQDNRRDRPYPPVDENPFHEFNTTRVLDVVVTDEEFQAIKKAALAAM
jgi:hypothetical protein